MKKYKYTNIYNWEILNDNDTHILWVRRNERSGSRDGFIQFSYYKKDNRMSLDQSIRLHCSSFDEANFFVSKVLRAYYVDIPEEFQGRYFKLKKLQKISKSTI